MRGKINSRAKGARGEREVAHILREAGYTDARRGQQYCGTSGDADVTGLPGAHLEIKRTERLALYKAMAQAQRDARPGEVPIVIHRQNDKEWVAIMALDDFLDLWSRANQKGD